MGHILLQATSVNKENTPANSNTQSDEENSSNGNDAKKKKSAGEETASANQQQRNRANPTSRWTSDETERLLEYVRANLSSFEVPNN